MDRLKMLKDAVPEHVVMVCEMINGMGHVSYVVGGAVRDILSGDTPKDFDIATNAKPDEIEAMFGKTNPIGKEHGTIEVILEEGHKVEITTFRSEGEYSDMRRPDEVKFSNSLADDLSRRDYTVNAIAYDPIEETIHDPYKGQEDILERKLHTVGDANERIQEDPLRMLRGIRICMEKNFEMTEALVLAIQENSNLLNYVANERIRDEFIRILMCDRCTEGLYMLLQLELLPHIVPELLPCVGAEQREDYHQYDVFGHIAHAIHYAYPDEIVKLATLLHDIGKPEVVNVDDDGVIHHYRHEEVSADMANKILSRLKFSNHIKDRVIALVKEHMSIVSKSDKALRKLLSRLESPEQGFRFARLRYADRMGGRGEEKKEKAKSRQLISRISSVFANEQALKVTDLYVDGNDIMEELGIMPGPAIGEILNEILERVIDSPGLHNLEDEMNLLIEIGKKHDEYVPF